MGRARKRAASPEEEEGEEPREGQESTELDEMEADELSAQSLQFDEPLTWRAGKPIPVSELLRRLQALAKELSGMQQSMVDRDSVVPRAQELGHSNLINHKDKGVVAWTLVCITDIFRLLAPDAPYKQSQLRSVFGVLTSSIIPALANPADPYHAQHADIMNSLTKYKSIVLMTDLPGSDGLIHDLFRNCFDVLAGTVKGSKSEILPARTIAFQFMNLMHFIIDELDSLPPGVLDIILAQFLRADPRITAESASNDYPPGYAMAMTLCNQSESKIGREVTQYFTSVLGSASEAISTSKPSRPKGRKRTGDALDDEDELATPPPELELDELEKAHSLLRELWRAAPGLISHVIPAIESEMTSGNVRLRVAATQTIGDMIAGIGAAGPPPTVALDPAAYPSQSLQEASTTADQGNVLLRSSVLRAFSTSFPDEYQAFVLRCTDTSPLVRIAWATAASRIVSTDAGGAGLEENQEAGLVKRLSECLIDHDERVRLAAIRAFAEFGFQVFSQKIGKGGGVDQEGSPLWNLAQRPKDLGRSEIRTTSIELLGKLWGVASAAIAEGNDRVTRLFGGIPSALFEVAYTNKADAQAAVLQSLYESLLPIGYPPIKPLNRAVDSHDSQDPHRSAAQEDPDVIRTERILVLFRSLTDKAKTVFIHILSLQQAFAKTFDALLVDSTQLYAGKVAKKDKAGLEKRIEQHLSTLVSKYTADTELAKRQLIKFCKTVDKRNFHLIRFCYDPTSDYRRISKALRELRKNIEADQDSTLRDSLRALLPVVRLCSLLVYNRSHIPPIMDFARTDDKGLGQAAHDVLTHISKHSPDVFKLRIRELCNALQKQAPSAATAADLGVADTLKACAIFAGKSSHDMPKDREFVKALLAYAKFGTPPRAAKQAVTVLLIVGKEKKEMYIKELLDYCTDGFELDDGAALSKLATLAQLQLLANSEVEDRADEILEVAATKVLKAELTAEQQGVLWSDTVDGSLMARVLALKILVNGIRGLNTEGDPREAVSRVREPALRVYTLLNTLIRDEGELSKGGSTAEYQNARIRLVAASQLLKLSCNRVFDKFLGPQDFNELSKLCQDARLEVRQGLLAVLKKYLGQGRLNIRFLAPIFLYAFEPREDVKADVMTWLRSQAAKFAKQKEVPRTGFILALFLSLLAHHPDFSTTSGLFAQIGVAAKDEVDESRLAEDFQEMVQYITFFLQTMASEESVSVMFHIAQRLKSHQDAISPKTSENLYVLSELAQETIRQFCEVKRWQLSTHPRKETLPNRAFAPLPGGESSKRIADRQYVPNEYLEQVEDLVKNFLKTKKRKAEKTSDRAPKKAKTGVNGSAHKAKTNRSDKRAKTPKASTRNDVPDSERRKSGRAAGSVNYAESDGSEVDEDDDIVLPDDVTEEDQDHDTVDARADDEMVDEEQQADDDDDDDDLSTPPTSEPAPKRSKGTTRNGKVKPAPKATSKALKASKKAAPAEARSRSTRQAPARGTKTKGHTPKKDRDIMSIPSDTDEEMDDA